MTFDAQIHMLSNAIITITYFVEDVENMAMDPKSEDGKNNMAQVRAALANIEAAIAQLRDLRSMNPG